MWNPLILAVCFSLYFPNRVLWSKDWNTNSVFGNGKDRKLERNANGDGWPIQLSLPAAWVYSHWEPWKAVWSTFSQVLPTHEVKGRIVIIFIFIFYLYYTSWDQVEGYSQSSLITWCFYGQRRSCFLSDPIWSKEIKLSEMLMRDGSLRVPTECSESCKGM